MREREVGAVAQLSRKQLQTAPAQPPNFHKTILAVVTTNFDGCKPHLGGKIADLKRIARRQHNRVTALFKFADDGFEERNVRRIIQVNPDFH